MSEDFFNVKLVKKEGDAGGLHVTSASERPLAAGTEILSLTDSNEIYTILPDGSRVFRQKFNVQGYEPGDLQVKVDGNAIRVTAKHEEKYGGKTSSTRQFNRQVDVPENVNPDKLVSYLSPDGILTLEAPVEVSVTPTKPKKAEASAVMRSSPFGVPSGPPQYEAIVKSAHQSVYNTPVIDDTDYGKKMKMVIKMGGAYDPEDVKIQLFDHKVSVKAKHEESIGGRSSKREFSREFDLPHPLYDRSFRAVITPDGNLVFGGSLLENEDQRSMSQLVYNDMPRDGKQCFVDTP
ncbi:hypothetical protein CAPTEDRAFT_174341 [Capitella teleta]|uniref:SHSP domain-containing protein n=1 Tax=Capitella teleta TaxID=283909 RepID=R7VDZ8_CAPTE|nr:hypothetical protein CAPTEDRAFT_174341 [Capitella teleta]|eukprot:ELU14531.1 hypothetical protein CAPTEDRAFT_174341 [Capitella teleta]